MKQVTSFITCIVLSFTVHAQLIDTTIHEKWSDGKWESTGYATHYTYNGNEDISEIFFLKLDKDDNILKPNHMAAKSYSNNGLLVESKYHRWDDKDNSWEPDTRNTYTHNAAGQEVTNTHMLYLDNAWMYNYVHSSTYDANGLMTQKVARDWDSFEEEWENESKVDITYNSAGLALFEIHSKWDNGMAGNWVNYERLSYVYNEDNQVTKELKEVWNETSWASSSQRIFKYDANKKLTEFSYQSWNKTDGEWNGRSIDYYDYNEKGYVTQVTTESGTQINGETHWALSRRIRHIYYTPTGLLRQPGSQQNVFPNPFTSTLSIHAANNDETEVSIQDLGGRIMYSGTLIGNATLNVEDYPSGMYLISLERNGYRSINKVIKP